MENKINLYERYTSTSALAKKGVLDEAVLTWSEGYFKSHYTKLLPINKDSSILEVGCGYGRYLKAMLAMGYSNCYGIDISEQQVEYAKTKLNINNIERADALVWLKNKISEYDCIFVLDVLEHLSNDELIELGIKLHKALKPGGVLIIQVPNGLSPLSPFLWGDLTHKRAFTVTSMEQFLKNINFNNFVFREIGPHIYTYKDYIRKILWLMLCKPLIMSFMKIANGGLFGGIFTANFMVVATKDSK